MENKIQEIEKENSAGEIPAEEVQELMNLDCENENSSEENIDLVIEKSKRAKKVKVKKDRLGIFLRNWMEVTALSPHMLDKAMRSWKKGQVVLVDSDIDRLIALNAPMKVYVEDGSN